MPFQVDFQKHQSGYIIPAKSAKATCYKNILDTTSACFHSSGYFGEWDAYLAVLRTSFQPPNEWPLDSLLILTLLHRDLRPADQCVNWERWINALSDKLLSLSLSSCLLLVLCLFSFFFSSPTSFLSTHAYLFKWAPLGHLAASVSPIWQYDC